MSRRSLLLWVSRGLLLVFFATTGQSLAAADITKLTDQGVRLFEKGEFDKALRIFLKVKKEEPTHPLAKEYIHRCTAKIVEAEKDVRLRRAIRKGESSSATILPKDPAPAWSVSPSRQRQSKSSRSKKSKQAAKTVLPYSNYEQRRTGASFIDKRNQLADGYKNKILEGPAIEVVRKGKNVEVVAFMNRLFLPFSDSLAPDAVPSIVDVANELQSQPGKSTVLRAVDSLTPAVRHQMLDLPARRVSILFSLLMQASTGDETNEGKKVFSAADLDD